MSSFAEATAVHRVGEGVYEATLDAGWSIGTALNGGYLLSILAEVGVDALPHLHAVATSGHFLAPPAPGSATVEVTVLRAGRTVSAAQVVLCQQGQPRLAAIVTAADLASPAGDPAYTAPAGDPSHAVPAGDPSYAAPAPAPLPPYDACLPARGPLPDGTTVGLLDQVSLRLDPATAGWVVGRPSGALEMRGWLELPGAEAVDALALPLAVDALPPTPFNIGVQGWCPTVELTCLQRGLPAPGPLAVHLSGRLARDGWVDEAAEVYDATGRLVAQSRQLARLPRPHAKSGH